MRDIVGTEDENILGPTEVLGELSNRLTAAYKGKAA
jgi:hypothetical protein